MTIKAKVWTGGNDELVFVFVDFVHPHFMFTDVMSIYLMGFNGKRLYFENVAFAACALMLLDCVLFALMRGAHGSADGVLINNMLFYGYCFVYA